jgi:hypothetical protein
MTALLEQPIEATTRRDVAREREPDPAWTARHERDELRALLMEQRDALATQRRILETLDARREQLDELIADAMPIVNAALLLATRTAGVVDTELRPRLAVILDEFNGVRRAPAPSVVALLWQMRDPAVRKTLALTLAALRVAGRLAGGGRTQADDTRAPRAQSPTTTPTIGRDDDRTPGRNR